MKKLIIIFGLFLIPYLGTSQNINRIMPVDISSGSDTIFYIRYDYVNGDSTKKAYDTLNQIELDDWLNGWEAWGQRRHNQWTDFQLRDSIFVDSIQALYLIYGTP